MLSFWKDYILYIIIKLIINRANAGGQQTLFKELLLGVQGQSQILEFKLKSF